MGNDKPIMEADWPEWSHEAMEQEETEMAVQINGKVRAHIEVPTAIEGDEAALKKEVLEIDRIRERVDEDEIKKFIVVPGNLVNIVV